MQCTPTGAGRQRREGELAAGCNGRRPGVRSRRGRRNTMRIGRATVAALLAAGLCRGADPPVEKLTVKPRKIANHEWVLPAGTPAEQVKWVIDRQKQLRDDFAKKFKAAKAEAEQRAMFEAEYPVPDAPARLLTEIVTTHPTDPAALDALLWVAR